MLTYEQGVETLGKRQSKKLGNNTYLERVGPDCLGVKLHGTYVVRICSDGSYVLHTGGWQTSTTKDRINSYSPARVYQSKREWFLSVGEEGGKCKFEDGIRVDRSGKPL